MSIVDQVSEIVKNECMKNSPEHWTYHIVHVVYFSKKLAEKMDVDEEILVLGALLHDFGGVVHNSWENHHVLGAEESQKVLERLNYPQEKIDLVKGLALNHRSSVSGEKYSKETRLLRDADAMAHFVDVPYLLYSAYVHQNKDTGQAREWLLAKLERSWNKLSGDAKEMVRKNYEAAKIVLAVPEK